MNILRTYFNKFRLAIITSAHLIISASAYFLAYLLRFDFSPAEYLHVFSYSLPILIAVKIPVFYYFRLFHSSMRHVGMFDLRQIIKANCIASVVFMVAIVFVRGLNGFPRSIFILDWGLCLGTIFLMRFIIRIYYERVNQITSVNGHKTLIVGAGEAGIMLAKECRRNKRMLRHIVGFIDDDLAKQKIHIQGVKVCGTTEDIKDCCKKMNVEEVIIAIPSASGEAIRHIIESCQLTNAKISIIPALHNLLNENFELKLRDVKPEDLLGRESVQINHGEISGYIRGQKVLITGSAGSIGSELARQIAEYEPERLILIDYNENDMYFLQIELRKKFPHLSIELGIGDVKLPSFLKQIFSRYKPDIVFHAAAYKHLSLMEENPSSAVKNNVISTRNLIYAAEHYRVKDFVFISTDKAVNPTSILGATKRIAEIVLQTKSKNSRTKFMAVRFGNVLGSKGSVVPLFKKQIDEGGPVTITHPEAHRYFMSIKEAVELVLQASSFGKGGEIFILDMGDQIKILDLAKNLITMSGFQVEKDIKIEYIGLRPGEKLYEETLLNVEKDKATKHQNIYVAQPNHFDARNLRRNIKDLDRLANIMDDEGIILRIKQILPDYIYSKEKRRPNRVTTP